MHSYTSLSVTSLQHLLATIHKKATLVNNETALGATYTEATMLHINLTGLSMIMGGSS